MSYCVGRLWFGLTPMWPGSDTAFERPAGGTDYGSHIKRSPANHTLVMVSALPCVEGWFNRGQEYFAVGLVDMVVLNIEVILISCT